MMTPLQNLHYALGEIAYAVASVDGKVQKEERQRFHDIMNAETSGHDLDFDFSDIIFTILDKDKQSAETTYNWAMDQIKLNSHYLSPALKESFLKIIDQIAEAFPPVTDSEKGLIARFKKDLEPLKGDPAYYN